MQGLKNKVALITGAAKGIGKAIAIALASQGYNVIISDIDINECKKVSDKIRQRYKLKSLAIKCDVSNKKEVDLMVKSAVDKFKKIDILINNAGIFPSKPFKEMEEADWDKVLNTNLKSVYLCSHSVTKYMIKGVIINISSIASIKGFPGMAHYCASKSGINGLTRVMALELAPDIRVNAIAPGLIITPGVKKGVDKKVIAQMASTVPLKRAGLPEDIANLAVFLASDESSYITGQVLVIDGGWTVK